MTIEFPNKEIGGHEATTLRVALGHFIHDMYYDGLGADEHGKSMTKSYLRDARKMEKIIVDACNNASIRSRSC